METNESEQNNLVSRFLLSLKYSISVKIAVVIFIILLLLIPKVMIEELIHERQQNSAEATLEVSQKWGGAQVVSGPVLNIPYRKISSVGTNGVTHYATEYAHFLPEKLDIIAQVNPVVRNRGIYKVVLYEAEVQVSGNFKHPKFEQWGIDPSLIKWEEATLDIGISDLSGVQNRIQLNWDGKESEVASGITNHDVFDAGVSRDVRLTDSANHAFSYTVVLNGSQSFNTLPIGKETTVKVNSAWPHPSFTGQFIPDHHEVTDQGFQATWKILDLNRNYPQQWKSNSQSIMTSAFGTNFILPVDEYQKNLRSIKYGMLIICLTFMMFFLVEILNSKRFHPIQYILVGLAITLFYILLISITEHLGFDWAYAISSTMIIALLILYISYTFNSITLTLIAGISMTAIYGFIYVILQLEDYSLLVGSIGLFIALSLLMYLSRKIDWYNIGKQVDNQ